MQKPQGYDEAQAAMGGSFPRLPRGYYVCKVISVKVGPNSKGAEMMSIGMDISRGEYKEFFKQQYDRRKQGAQDAAKVKWPCVYRQNTGGKSVGMFKGLIMTFEQCNPGYKWQFGEGCENSLKNLEIGVKFEEEDYIGNDGRSHTSVKPVGVEPIEGLEDKVMPPKPAAANNSNNGPFGQQLGLSDNDIPF